MEEGVLLVVYGCPAPNASQMVSKTFQEVFPKHCFPDPEWTFFGPCGSELVKYQRNPQYAIPCWFFRL